MPICNVVDLSHHNTVGGNGPALAGFQEAKAAGVLGVIHKATQGIDYTDRMYASRRKAALEAGLLWGAYHFADDSDIVRQVAHFMAVTQPDANTLMALDWEPNTTGPTMTLDHALQFLELLGRVLGRKPVVYSGSLAKEQLGSRVNPFFAKHRLWLAQYGQTWKVQESWSKPWLWQFAEAGSVAGIGGAVDHNFYNGTPEELKAEWAG